MCLNEKNYKEIELNILNDCNEKKNQTLEYSKKFFF